MTMETAKDILGGKPQEIMKNHDVRNVYLGENFKL